MAYCDGDERPNNDDWEIYLEGKWYKYSKEDEITIPAAIVHRILRESFNGWKFFQIMNDIKEIKGILGITNEKQ